VGRFTESERQRGLAGQHARRWWAKVGKRDWWLVEQGGTAERGNSQRTEGESTGLSLRQHKGSTRKSQPEMYSANHGYGGNTSPAAAQLFDERERRMAAQTQTQAELRLSLGLEDELAQTKVRAPPPSPSNDARLLRSPPLLLPARLGCEI
jgi:hypothetical protein